MLAALALLYPPPACRFARDAATCKAVGAVLLPPASRGPTRLSRWLVARDAFDLADATTAQAIYDALAADFDGVSERGKALWGGAGRSGACCQPLPCLPRLLRSYQEACAACACARTHTCACEPSALWAGRKMLPVKGF